MNKKNNPSNNKKRLVKDYDALPEDIVTRIKLQYPKGFAQNLVYYTNKDGKKVSALPFETDDIYYLVRMTIQEAKQIIEDDNDYDDGILRTDFGSDSGDSENGDDDDAYFHNQASTIEYADPEYGDAGGFKDKFQASEFADADLSALNLDALADEDEDKIIKKSNLGMDDDSDDEEDNVDFPLDVDDDFDYHTSNAK